MGIVWSFWKRRLPSEEMTKSAKVAAKPCVGFVVALGASSSPLRPWAAARSEDFSVCGALAAVRAVGGRAAAGASLASGRGCFICCRSVVIDVLRLSDDV